MPPALAPIADVRLRLEGQLEVVERSLRALEEGVALLAQNDASGLVEVLASHLTPEARQAEAEVRKMAANEPSLTDTIATLEQSHARFAAAVDRRLRELKLPALPLPEAVVAIADEPIRYSSHWARRAMPALPLPLMLSLAAIFSAPTLAAALMACALPVSVSVGYVLYLYSNRATLTSRRLIIGSKAFELAGLAVPRAGAATQNLVRRGSGANIGYDVVDSELSAAMQAHGVVLKPRT